MISNCYDGNHCQDRIALNALLLQQLEMVVLAGIDSDPKFKAYFRSAMRKIILIKTISDFLGRN